MIPLVGFAQEGAFVKLGSNQKNAHQVQQLRLVPSWCWKNYCGLV